MTGYIINFDKNKNKNTITSLKVKDKDKQLLKNYDKIWKKNCKFNEYGFSRQTCLW